MSDHDNDAGDRRGTSRRQFLRNAALFGAAAAAGPSVLAACGSSKKSTSGANTTAGNTGGSSASGGSSGGGSSDAGKQLAQILKIDPSGKNGQGVTWQLGAVLALSGAGSFYGKTMSRGTDLAVKHVAAAGGPNIKVTYWDHKSGDAAAGKQAMTEIVAKKIPAKLASYVDDLGAMLQDTAANHVFTLDGGGGTSEFGKGIPYFWGTRAITPNDTLPGVFEWFKQTHPGKMKVGLTGWDVGEPSNSKVKADVLAKIQAAGLQFNNLYELTPVGSQDYSAVLPKIKSNEPDLLIVGLYGQDIGSFFNQAQTAGLSAQIMGSEFTPDGVNASKGTFDSKGYTFAYDYFDANNPKNPLAKLFVSEFKKAYNGDLPDFYAANFYENVLVMWEVIRRVLAKGGDINDGTQLDKALQDNLTVVSVYGDDPNAPGTYTLDPTTHSVKKREMGVFQYKGGKVTPQAFFGIDADGYHKA